MSDFWQGKNVLVTGWCGLIGAYLCEELQREGAIPVGYDMMHQPILPTLTTRFVEGDINDVGKVFGMMGQTDVCFHMAAVSGVVNAKANASHALWANVLGVSTVLQAAREHDKPIVLASSNHVYGAEDGLASSENSPLNQLDMYSVTKICGDYLARAWAHNYGTKTAIVRNTNCFGPYDPHHDHIIPGTILSLLKGQGPIIKGSGETRKAYMHVKDVARAYMAVAELLMTGGMPGEVFNVTPNDSPVSVLELVWGMIRLMGSDLAPDVLDEPNDQHDEHLDGNKVRALTDWRPQYTLDEALLETIEHYREALVPA